jgi:membrane protease YdiL (CAAX protease family)
MDRKTMDVKPIPLWKSIILFAGTSMPIFVGVYCIIPLLQSRGLTFLWSYLIAFYPTFGFMFLLALFLYRNEGNPLNWASFSKRYRIFPIVGKSWFWVIGLFLFGVAVMLGLSFTGKWLASIPLLAPADYFPPEINPLKEPIPGLFFGTEVHGQWGYALVYFIGWVFNILGEELLWRGYLLPRQEASYGRWAWVVHGLLWTLWHVFWKWNLLNLLPITLSIAYVGQKTKNTLIPILVHGAVNFVPLMGLIYYIIA